MSLISAMGKGTGNRPDYLANRDVPKKCGGSSEKIERKSRNSRQVNGGWVGAHGQLTQGANWSKS